MQVGRDGAWERCGAERSLKTQLFSHHRMLIQSHYIALIPLLQKHLLSLAHCITSALLRVRHMIYLKPPHLLGSCLITAYPTCVLHVQVVFQHVAFGLIRAYTAMPSSVRQLVHVCVPLLSSNLWLNSEYLCHLYTKTVPSVHLQFVNRAIMSSS